jgi:hypothetical protein
VREAGKIRDTSVWQMVRARMEQNNPDSCETTEVDSWSLLFFLSFAFPWLVRLVHMAVLSFLVQTRAEIERRAKGGGMIYIER